MFKYVFLVLVLFIGLVSFQYPYVEYHFGDLSNESQFNIEELNADMKSIYHYPFGEILISLETLEADNIEGKVNDWKLQSKYKKRFEKDAKNQSIDDYFTASFEDQLYTATILDEDEELEVGSLTMINSDQYLPREANYNLSIKDGRMYGFTLDYGVGFYELLLNGEQLYIANYIPNATGATLQCFNLNTEKIEWIGDVLHFEIAHSKYSNRVTLSLYNDTLIMEGNEDAGDYVQFFDAKTGERLAEYSEMKNN